MQFNELFGTLSQGRCKRALLALIKKPSQHPLQFLLPVAVV